jgi:hypothetical protein
LEQLLANAPARAYLVDMKLRQGQVYKMEDQYVRIVVLHRLEVEYKVMKELHTREGTHHHTSKKAFCTLIKKATLLEPAPVQSPG